MKALVCVKRVIDYNVNIQVKSDGSGVVTDNVKMSMNPFDEIALEEAIKMRENSHVSHVTALTIASAESEDILRQSLAMGADHALRVDIDQDVELEPLAVSKIIAEIVKDLDFDFVIMGKQAIDNDCNQTGQMLASILDWPQAVFASKVEVTKDGFNVSCEVDSGIETIAVKKPCVITTDLRLNQPRYIALPNILKARQKTIEVKTLSDFTLDTAPKLNIINVTEPETRKAGKKYSDIKDFLCDLDKNGVL